MAAVVYASALYDARTTSVLIVVAKTSGPCETTDNPQAGTVCSCSTCHADVHCDEGNEYIDQGNVYAWSDSTITLGWIRTPPAR